MHVLEDLQVMAARRRAKQKRQGPAARASASRPADLGAPPAYATIPSFFRLVRKEPGRRVPPVDVLLTGLPFDGGSGMHAGARLGPEAVRRASMQLGSYSDALGIDVTEELTLADGGDVPASPHDTDAALEAMASRAEAIARSGAIGGFVGGDQTVTLAALRGIKRAKLRSIGLVHLDSCSDTLGPRWGRDLHHHSVLRCAVAEGLLTPESVIQVGLRGPQVSQEEMQYTLGLGFEIIKADDVKWDLYSAIGQIRKVARSGPIYVSVDLSVLDPAYAPGVASPRPGGVTSWELQQLLRALVGTKIVGFDLVEVSPPGDPAGVAALGAASALHELLAVLADTRRSGTPAQSSGRRKVRGKRLSP